MTDFDLLRHCVLLVTAGSRAYGLHGQDSDVDIKGVIIPPRQYFLGALKSFEQADQASELESFEADLSDEEKAAVANSKLEGSLYGIRKFVRLAAEANPNILEVLSSYRA